MKQGSAEWLQARVGKVTASRVHDVVGRSKRDQKPLQAYHDYLAELVAERLTLQTYEHYVNAAMEWGIEQEEFAATAYEVASGEFVDTIGYVEHPTIDGAGASPDRLVGDDGLVEIKCPTTGTHIKTLLSETIDPKYIAQMQWQMACTGRLWCDFVSYDPRLPEEYRLFIKRVERDDEYIADAEAKVREFLDEVSATVEALKEKWAA